jgi:DNA-binding NarL/FixJ family response regulator
MVRNGQLPTLSRREGEVLQLACQGLSDKEIARELGIACVTVRTYVARLLVKFGAANRTQLGSMAAEEGNLPETAALQRHLSVAHDYAL